MTCFLRHLCRSSTAVAGVLALCTAANATIINVAINSPAASVGNGYLRSDGTTQSNPAAAGATSGTWNEAVVSGNTISSPAQYVDSSNGNTGLTVALSNFNGPSNCPSCAYGSAAPLLEQYMVQVDPTSATVTLGGLTIGETYNLYLYGSNNGGGAGAQFSVNGVGPQFTSGGDGSSTFPGFTSATNFVEFTTAAVNVGGVGELVVTVSGAGSASGYPGGSGGPLGIINGFQLQSVPEPSSLVLLGLGVLGLLAVARRRRRPA